MRWGGGDEVDDSAERVRTVESGPGTLENLDRFHRFERNWQIEIVMRRLSVVGAETIDEDKRLSEAAATQDDVGLRAAGAALLNECRSVVAKKIERRLNQKQVRLHGKNVDGAGRLGEGNRSDGAEDDEGFGWVWWILRGWRGDLRAGSRQRTKQNESYRVLEAQHVVLSDYRM